MKVFWSNTRPNGDPLASGVCLVTDLEDGTHPIYTYGADSDEVYQKLALMNGNAQMALARRAPAQAQTPPDGARSTQAPQPRRTIGPDQVMQATADLSNPSKASDAVATLLEHATGVDPRQESARIFGELAQRWGQRNPEFYPHPANQQLMADRIFALTAGKMGAATFEMLDQVFGDLHAKGVLAERPEPIRTDPNDPALTQPRPGESQAPQVTERPRGMRFATGASSLRFGASQIPKRTPKYTEEQIRTMPLEKERELIQSNDRDYLEACEAYYGQGTRAAS